MGRPLSGCGSHAHEAAAIGGGGRGARARMRGGGRLALLRLLALAILASLAACGNARAAGPPPTPTTAIPAGWHLYHDPYGFFTIGLPPGWTAQAAPPSTGIVRDKQGSGTETDYLVAFGNPPHDPAGLTVDIFYHPLSIQILRTGVCQNMSKLAPGTPTTRPYFEGAGWFVETNAAHFQLSYFLDNRPEEPPYPATPIPQATQEAGAHLFARILATFTPTPNTPLQC